ncbi:MAG TPA: terminase [Planctomycetota bacterium]|nr:terminase [Planctomycetota bacterium]
MMRPLSEAEKAEAELADEVESYAQDPEGFVDFAFPWGEKGSPLEHKTLRTWQREFLRTIGERLRAGFLTPNQVIQEAVASGHGIGKSALIAMLIAWAMSTMEDTRGIITAGTDPQLKTKTWPEVCKWFNMLICAHWFSVEAMSITSKQNGHEETWRFDRVTWNKSRTEAFAGLHNEGKRLLIIFDEASQIDDMIYEVTEGALTDEYTEIIWAVFGNPTRNTGAFRRCFGAQRAMWGRGKPLQIDARTVEGTNKQLFNDLVKEYGEDSDRVRVRVRGIFPKASDTQFIDNEIVFKAQHREASYLIDDPLIIGIDMARGGADNVVFRFRRGLDARSIPPVRIPGSEVRDSMKLVAIATEIFAKHKPDAIFFDETGVGGPIGDRLKQLGYNIMGVNFGGDSPHPRRKNMRAHIWAKLKEALHAGLAIDDSPILESDLTNLDYDHDDEDRLRLEKKEHMKARGLASPDDGDALALTYSYHVAPKGGGGGEVGDGGSSKYDPLGS